MDVRKSLGIQVTFKCEGRVANYKPGRIYTETLTPYIEALLRQDRDLRLIDHLTIDEYKAQAYAALKIQEDEKAAALAKAEERSKSYGSKKSSNPPVKSEQAPGPSSEDGASEESGERSEGSESPSSDE